MRWTPLIFLLTTGVGFAQTSPSESPDPTPASSTAEVTPAPATGTETPASSPVSEVAPAATPAADSSDLPTSDVGTLNTLEPTVGGAPLTTDDVIPLIPPTDAAMPDEAFTDPNAIIPDELPPLPPPSVAIESDNEKQRELAVLYRNVRVKADQDPQIVAMREKADAATSMEDRRAALREYYRMLFKKIVAIDKSLKPKAEIMEEAYLRRLAQTRLEPTIPLNPPPTPEPIN